LYFHYVVIILVSLALSEWASSHEYRSSLKDATHIASIVDMQAYGWLAEVSFVFGILSAASLVGAVASRHRRLWSSPDGSLYYLIMNSVLRLVLSAAWWPFW